MATPQNGITGHALFSFKEVIISLAISLKFSFQHKDKEYSKHK